MKKKASKKKEKDSFLNVLERLYRITKFLRMPVSKNMESNLRVVRAVHGKKIRNTSKT